MREYVSKNHFGRPDMVDMTRGRNIEWTGIKIQNGPQFHFYWQDMDGVYFHDFEIYVDIWGQLKLNQFFDSTFGKLSKFPSFPLNTDGIDPSGKNILIERVKITNFDDAIAVKPMDSRGKIAQCTENVVARDIEVVYGVGMTIGTVPARSYYTCVKNVTFQNVTFHRPLKAIYIKQNP